MLRGALPALLLASATAFACNALTGAGDLVASDVDAGVDAGRVTGDGATAVPTATATQIVPELPPDAGADAAEAGADAGHDAGKDAGPPPPLTGTFGGHTYEVVLAGQSIDWDDAEFAAAQKGGTLAAITTAAENAFVLGLLGNAVTVGGPFEAAWIGGAQDVTTAQAPADKWGWVTKEAWSFTNWDVDEPNDGGGLEDFLAMYTGSGVWNDYRIGGDSKVPAYVIEYAH